MKNRWISSVFLCVIVVVVALGYQTSLGQVSSPLFVVYGNVTLEQGTPISGMYTVVIRNLQTGAKVEDNVEIGQNAGKYSGVFVNLLGGTAVAVGDIITASVRMQLDPNETDTVTYEVTVQDVLDMKVMIDIIIRTVAADSKTWGAIKALFE